MDKIWSKIDLFLPYKLERADRNEIYRARMFISSHLFICILMIIMLEMAYFLNQPFRYGVLFSVLAISLVSLILNKFLNNSKLMSLITGLAFLSFMMVTIYKQGSLVTSMNLWIPFVPIIITLVAGKLHGLIATLYAVGSYIIVYSLLKETGLPLRPDLTFDEFISVQFVNIVSITTLFYLLSIFIDSSRKHLELNIIKMKTQVMENSRHFLLSKLSSGVAHEINNPLCAIRFSVDLIRNNILMKGGIEKEKLLEVVERINNGVEKASSVIDGLRKVSDSSGSLEFKYISIEDILTEVQNLYRKEMIEKRIEFGVERTYLDHTDLFCQQTRILEAFMHLIDNAIDATRSSELKRIFIKTEKNNNYLLFHVLDNGVGVPSDILDKIFDPFFTTKDVQEGTGLGLTIAQSIASTHSGFIKHSRKDEFTCFTLAVGIV